MEFLKNLFDRPSSGDRHDSRLNAFEKAERVLREKIKRLEEELSLIEASKNKEFDL